MSAEYELDAKQRTLMPALFARAFPFYLVLDRQMRIVQFGRSLARALPELTIGTSFEAIFSIALPLATPATFEQICPQQRSSFCLKSNVWNFELNGQMVYEEQQDLLFFLGSPSVQDLSEVEDLGLSVRDFALHDPTTNLLHLLQSRNTSIDNARSLQKKLEDRIVELQNANEKLLAQQRLTSALNEADNFIDAIPAALEACALVAGAPVALWWTLNHEIHSTVCTHIWGPTFTRGELRQALIQNGHRFKQSRHSGAVETVAGNHGLGFSCLLPITDKGKRAATIELLWPEDTEIPADRRELLAEFQIKLAAALMHQRTTQELDQQEQLLRAMTGSTPLGFLVLDSQTDEVRYINDRVFSILELPQRVRNGRAIAGSTLIERALLHVLPTDAEAFRDTFEFIDKESLSEGSIEATLRFHSGRSVRVFSTRIESQENDYIGRLYMFEETTEQRAFEAELATARDEAVEASRLKSEFVATMSHEIRTPMNGVIGVAGLLEKMNLTDEQQEYVGIIQRSGEALMLIINDILDFSKIEAGGMSLLEADFSLQVMMDETMSLFARKSSPMLEIGSFVDPDVPSALHGDSGKLRQVLTNLISNALKFTEQGEVSVQATLARLDDTGIQIRFEVRDTGIGIHRDSLPLLFEPFRQINGSWTRQHGGTGLGLSICSRLVELMGGEIGVESTPGVGSTFWFDIQVKAAIKPVARLDITDPLLKGRRILGVDDTAINRQVLKAYLSLMGVEITCVADGNSALTTLHDAQTNGRPFEAVVLDLHMPNMDGLTLAHRIRQDEVLADLPLLLFSSSQEAGMFQAAREQGIEHLLLKPIREQKLRRALMSIFRGERIDLEQDSLDGDESLHILLVEDNTINQRVTQYMLSWLGHTCDIATDGQNAVEAIRATRYAMVLMDCQMPIMDGFEATRAMRKLPLPLSKLPIVAMTANAAEGDRERCLSAGMDDYISKPITLQSLSEAIQRNVIHQTPTLSDQPVVIAAVPKVVAVPPKRPPDTRVTIRVLIAEDNLINQVIIRRLIEKMGHHCTVAVNGAQLIRRVEQENWDIILMDLQMLIMDGFDATRRIRAMIGPERNLPIIAVTANTTPADKAKCRLMGMNGFISKPVSYRKLEDAIKKAIVPKRKRNILKAG